jgi:hypothetical protein
MALPVSCDRRFLMRLFGFSSRKWIAADALPGVPWPRCLFRLNTCARRFFPFCPEFRLERAATRR